MNGEPPFRLEQRVSDGCICLAASGEIDMLASPLLEDALREASERARTIELDLHEVSFIDSTGIRVILGAKELCAERSIELLLVPSRHEAPQRVFELTGLLDRLPWRARRD